MKLDTRAVIESGEGLAVLYGERIEAWPLPLEEAVAFSRQIIEGLQSTP
jgi:hypothetical protein